jgi:hypothetical protein
MRRALAILLLATGLVGATGCTSARSGAQVGGSASCADVVRFRGERYVGNGVGVSPVTGRVLGKAVMAPCDDTGGQLPPEGGGRVAVAEIPGVPPSIAVAPVDQNNVIYVRDGRTKLPPEVRRLMHAPACVSADAPIRLAGPWLGILGPNAHTEVDLVPPYDVSLLAMDVSSSRYARAFLDVHVPASLGRPITRPQLRASLLHGGTISITATCRDGRYVATHVETAPAA